MDCFIDSPAKGIVKIMVAVAPDLFHLQSMANYVSCADTIFYLQALRPEDVEGILRFLQNEAKHSDNQ